MHLRVLLPVVKSGTGAYYYFHRLADSLRCYTDCSVDIFEFNHIYEVAPWLVRRGSLGNYDIVCANSAYAFAFKRLGKKLIAVEMHSLFDEVFLQSCSVIQKMYYRCLIQRYVRRSFKSADHIVCISNFTAKKSQYIVNIEKISVIYPWIDMAKFSPALDDNTSSSVIVDRQTRLLCVGSISGRKGSSLLPELARRLGEKFSIQCVTKDADKWFDAPPDNLQLKGWVSEGELIAAYQRADAILTTSYYEGFGYTLLEGMACGKPVVGFDLDVFREVVPPEGYRYLAKVGDVSELVECCRLLARDLRAAAIDGRKLREYAVDKFDPQALASTYYNLFCDTLRRAV